MKSIRPLRIKKVKFIYIMTTAYFKNIQDIILQALSKAKERIYVAMAWFTNTIMSDALIECRKRNISVEIIFIDDIINRSEFGIDFGILSKAGIKIRMKAAHTLMHNKFCVIDKTVITGSYNWTYFANQNDENIILSDREGLADSYIQYFHELWKTGSELPSPYEHTKWSLSIKDDFNELKRNLYRDIQAKNDINTELKKQKIIEIDKAIKNGSQLLIEKAAKIPVNKQNTTIVDVLLEKTGSFKFQLWKQANSTTMYNEKYCNVGKWIFTMINKDESQKISGILKPLELEKSPLATHMTRISFIHDSFAQELSQPYIKTPEKLVTIPLAKLVYYKFPYSMHEYGKTSKILGIYVLGIIKEINDGEPIYYKGWDPYIKGKDIMNRFFIP